MENAPIVTNEMIEQYKPLVYKIYMKKYSHYFPYLKQDLIQCGMWGLYMAYQKFDITRSTDFVNFAGCWVQCKMRHYLKHEKHHINEDFEDEYDFKDYGYDTDYPTTLAVRKAYHNLSDEHKRLITKWLNGEQFNEMGYKSKQLAHVHFKKALNKLKEKLV